MSLFKSWLPSSSPRRPFLDSPPPTSATTMSTSSSSPRQPVGTSSLLRAPPAPVTSRSRRHGVQQIHTHAVDPADPHVAFERADRELQARLQDLLDAQAEGLLEGLGLESNAAHTGSIPEASMYSNGTGSVAGLGGGGAKIVPVRQPAQPRLSLRAARRGIGLAMRDLSTLRAEQVRVFEDEKTRDQDTLETIRGWEAKKESLTEEITSTRNAGRDAHTIQLEQQNDVLQEQINAVEMQLSELKEHQRVVRAELSTLESSVAAKLSSFQGSLALLEKDVATFLKGYGGSRRARRSYSKADSYLSLPPGRRTLSLAAEHASTEINRATEQRDRAERERTALDEGAVAWAEVVQCVGDFEAHLRLQLSANGSEEDMRGTLARLDATIDKVASAHEHAETRGWNLLVVGMAAELEALQQGREMLEDAISPGTPEIDPATLGIEPTSSPSAGKEEATPAGGDSPVAKSRYRDDEDADADEPDPDLLVSM